MAKRVRNPSQPQLFSDDLPGTALAARNRRFLFVPAYVKDQAQKRAHLYGKDIERAGPILKRWAKLETQGVLHRKEKALDAQFLLEVFGEALGYRPVTKGGGDHELEREFTVSGAGTADGAIGAFSKSAREMPAAVIELKNADVDLDSDHSTGRSPVQQCWDYLNALTDCPWGIVSNLISIRLYHRERTSRAYEEFRLQELCNPDKLLQFFHVLGRGGLLPTKLDPKPRALALLHMTAERQREVGDELYQSYSRNRNELIHHLHTHHGKSLDDAIAIAQKLLDRIIFVAFCEDRGLLPEKIIEKTYRNIPPLARVTNPRWKNFLDLFTAIDRGHRGLNLDPGFNGGLFAHDEQVDDLDLGDEWTDFFQSVGSYDFRDEINVDVLGHLFEKSVTELEKLRMGGLFGNGNGAAVSSMPKSAQRKRFGIYYTPPELTDFIVRSTLGAILDERCGLAALRLNVDSDNLHAATKDDRLAYWQACLDVLHEITVCDPACGSGAFLIRAYEFLEDRYVEVIDNLAREGYPAAEDLGVTIPDVILSRNLFGVDISTEAVEITQLALWIRSARRGRTLADLSKNIVCGNSLVDDRAIDPRAFCWAKTFPAIFDAPKAGFDCVIGNPPWERMKLQEREFFAHSDPKIASAVNAADRRKSIKALQQNNPDLYRRYCQAQDHAERTLDYARNCGRFPLTGKGDINTYMLFAELARTLVAPTGRVGVLVPSGIASDKTCRGFFNTLMDSKALITLYDFENRKAIFPDVHRSFKFCTLVFGGVEIKATSADFVFFSHSMADLRDRQRHIRLTAGDMALVNPNTRTCPIFRTRRDAQLTKAIYKRIPILIDRGRKDGGNPWGIRFLRMFDQTNAAELFRTPDDLKERRYKLDGNLWKKGKQRFLPLYEAKMVQAYDHRAASVIVDADNWVRQGQTASTTLVKHQNPEFAVLPRWWVAETEVDDALGKSVDEAYLCYKDVTSPTNERTMIAAFIPRTAVVNSAPLILRGDDISCRRHTCLLANLNSFVFDFLARQKVGGLHLNFFIVEQIPVLPPDAYADRCPWNERQTLERWISDRVLKLSCTANDMRPLAQAAGLKKGVHKWKPGERAHLRAELDAAYFLLYGITRKDLRYILSTFAGTQRRDLNEAGEYRTEKLILEAYQEMGG